MASESARADRMTVTTSGLQFASGADIIRSSQKDQYYVSLLISQFQSVCRRVLGSRTLNERNDEISTAASVLYLSITSLLGRRTLGEEYCDITYATVDGSSLPSTSRRAAFVATSTLLPYIVAKSWPKLKRRITSSTNQNANMARLVNVLYNYLTFQNIAALHLALFYFSGAFYTISRRVTGLRYIFTRKMEGSSDRVGYEILGFLMLVRLGIQLTSDLLPSNGVPYSNTSALSKTTLDLEDQSMMPFLDEQGRKCTLCLSFMQDPTATPCGHLFCWTCIGEWTRTKPECPLCRQGAVPSHLLPIRP